MTTLIISTLSWSLTLPDPLKITYKSHQLDESFLFGNSIKYKDRYEYKIQF